MKNSYGLLVALSLIVASGCASKNSSNLMARESATRGHDNVYATCKGSSFSAQFYGPAGADIRAINFVQLNNIIGRDAARMITSMSCEKSPQNPTQGEEYVSHGCMDTKELDGGIYSISLKVDESKNLHAILERVTSRGAKELAQMKCSAI
ncbi:MAG: hypothetical protein NTV34_16555 [Proteobacteria bacterium]|nr:hypothetical protein [Pseudomonadota bacterium]